MVLVRGQASIVTTRRVGPADLPPGPRQFVRRRSVVVVSCSLGLVFSSTFSEHTYHSSPRRSPLSLRKKMPLGLRRSNI
ncbi:hypothetical protein T10_6582 [Trichinella papuae]|uniref:Uncharacterized protein n=1 Tax=Trichinella papuae TaxID=268474 RepID=A0A0V1N9L2_9BILA|nr:hypothetical protein T10_6582 [Trichinella papuae]